ncbi:hypothetical protein QL285_054655 [Trifolium repens]|nr:hypothetical protein QL285_054655 [Trifolium repens]
MRVRDVFIDGNWNLNLLYTVLPAEIKESLASLPVNLNPEVSDCFTWKGNLNGIYTARDGYYWLNRNTFSANTTNIVSWSWLWRLPAPEKIKFLFWTMLHNALPTREMLSHRGIINNNLCPRCNNNVETLLHCLRDCIFVKSVWKSIGFYKQIFFQEDNLYDWLRNGTHSALMFPFMAAVWWIWRARNTLCMDNELVPVFTLKIRIVDYSLMLKNGLPHQHVATSTKLVRWNSLGGTGMILNVDGSSIGNPGVSGFGGLIRNSDGAWVHGFYGNLGVSNILHAELMAIYKGLLLAWELDIKELWCYSDSKTAISLITEPVDEWHHYAAIIHNIKDIITRDWQVIVSHTLREGNVCADYLAKYGAHNNEAFTTITNPPAGLSLPLLMDSCRTWFSR